VAAVGCGTDAPKDEVVASVAGTAIHRSQLDRAVEHARAAHATFPEEDTRQFVRARHAILEQLVLNVEILKAARRLNVAVPTAAVYEFVEEQGDEGQDQALETPPSPEDAAYARSTVRARLLYEAVARKVTAGATVRPREVERYYRAHRAELDRIAASSPARARLYAQTILLRRRQSAIMRRWVSATERRFRPYVHYSDGY
jgi:hypothetical protein